jgi:hypothetical protein
LSLFVFLPFPSEFLDLLFFQANVNTMPFSTLISPTRNVLHSPSSSSLSSSISSSTTSQFPRRSSTSSAIPSSSSTALTDPYTSSLAPSSSSSSSSSSALSAFHHSHSHDHDLQSDSLTIHNSHCDICSFTHDLFIRIASNGVTGLNNNANQLVSVINRVWNEYKDWGDERRELETKLEFERDRVTRTEDKVLDLNKQVSFLVSGCSCWLMVF